MEFKDYQKITFDKILKYDKSFIFWPRQIGKSTLLSYYIENFITNNNNKDIVFFNDDKLRNRASRNKLIHDIHYLRVKKKYTGVYEMSFLNDNYLTFCSIQESYEHILHKLKPSVIIYDEFYHKDLKKYEYLAYYLDNNNCKVIFTSTYIDSRIIKLFDSKNDFYINIRKITKDNIEPFFKNYDYKRLLRKDLSYKKTELLDFDDVIYQRKKKLEYLKKITNGK